MSDNQIIEQIAEINRKLDSIIEETTIQRQNREALNDLIDDASIIGKDAFRQMVIQLDDAGTELDSEALRCLLFRLLRNIKNLGSVIETLESLTDLAKDLTPIIRKIGLDGVQKFHEYEQKGYFEVLNQLGKTLDSFLSEYSIEDLSKLSENLIPVAETLVNIADPKLLRKINAAATALKEIEPSEIEEYSVWKMIRHLNKPEVRKSMGFMMAFLERMSKNNETQKI